MREFEHYHRKLLETSQNIYYVSTLGKIGFIKRLELQKAIGGMDESLIHWIEPITIVRGQKRLLQVVAGSNKYILKNLIARMFMPDYEASEHVVEHKNGDYQDCNLQNLFLISKHKLLSYKARHRKTKVIAVRKIGETEWKTYNSISEAARGLFVFNDTLANYLKKKSRNSVLMDYEFIVNGVKFIPRKRTGSNWRIKSGIL